MSNLFVTGLSGLQAFRQAMDVTGQNISNANTEGYVRQRADFTARESTPTGASWVGNGVTVSRLTRAVDEFLADQSRGSRSASSRVEVYAGESARVANLLGNAGGNLSAMLQDLDNALQGVAAEPGSIAARQALLGTLDATVAQIRSVDTRLRDFESEVNRRIASEATAVSDLADGIATLNRQIDAARTASSGTPNGLLDQRDKLLDELSAKISIRVVAAGDGSVNVFTGRGEALVLGDAAAKVVLDRDPTDSTRQRVLLVKGSASEDVTRTLSGGVLGGLSDFRSEVLDATRNEVGRIATVLASSLNEQHAKGIDLLGAAGGDLLSVGGPQAITPTTNGAVLTASATVTDARSLTGVDYQLEWSGSAWALRRADTGAAVSFTGTGSVGSPFEFDGLSVVVGGSPVAGDRVVLQPTREAASRMAVEVEGPARIAAALPVRASAASANTGRASVSALEVLDPTDPALRSPVTISFPTVNTVSVGGGPPQAWSAGQAIDFNGWRLRITGTPVAGDSFSVVDNSSGRGDNRNAILLAGTLRTPLLDSGTTSLAETATRLMSGVGSLTQQAQRNLEVQRLSYEDSVKQRQSVSGVNLDEEAANLLRYQQAYQASAQVIRTANEVFRILIDVTG